MEDNKVSYIGICIFFDPKKGYGFLGWRDNQGNPQTDLFVHFSDIICDGFKTIKKDQKVSFEIGENKRGQKKAVNVKVIDLN